MAMARLEEAVPSGEALRYHASLRSGGSVGVTDERLLVVDGEVVSVGFDEVVEVRVESFDWFLGVLSLALVGFGIYSTTRNVLAGLAFALVGVASLYRTYRRRGRVSVQVRNRAKPLRFHLDATDELQAELGPRLLAESSSEPTD